MKYLSDDRIRSRAVCAREPDDIAHTGEPAGELLRPGQELIVTRWIALAGTARIASAYEEELKRRFPAWLVDVAKRFADLRCVSDETRIADRFADDRRASAEAQIAAQFGPCVLHSLTRGGIFGALWETAEQSKVGLEIDLKKIPIRQETVEICEYFDVNPYYLCSEGSLLIGTDQAGELTDAFLKAGIPAVVIGYVTSGRGRLIHNGENTSYLNRPQPDEWERRFGI